MPERTGDTRRRQPLLRLLDRWFTHPPPTRPPLTPEPTADPRRRTPSPPSMVLVDRDVRSVNELQEFILETGGLTLHLSIESAVERVKQRPPECSSSSARRLGDREAQEQMAIQDEIKRYRAEVEEPAFALLRERKASRPSAVRKEPLPEAVDREGLYRDILDGIELCFPPVAEAPPGVTCLSLKFAWPPGRFNAYHSPPPFIASCHCCLLVLCVGTYRTWFQEEPGFYLVYNALANSVAIVPPLLFFFNYMSHCDIGPVAVLCCSMVEGEYILAELFLSRDVQTLLPTNKATLFIWASSSSDWWVEREVVLPLPTAADDENDTTTGTCSFHADMAFAVSFSSICWVDLLTGILVYNHIPSEQFHFIPLPEDCVTSLLRDEQGQRRPDEYRSMCCLDRQTLKFVAMDESYSQECPMLTTWTLRRPLSPTNWKWEKDAVSSFCMKDLWEDQVYKDKLLRPNWPRCPVFSTQEPGIIYLSVTDYEDNDLRYVLSLNMDRCRIESVYKVPYAIAPRPRLFTSDFSRYLNKTREWELMHGARGDLYKGPRGKEKIADEVESKTPYTFGVDLGILKLSRCRVIPTPGTPSSRKAGLLASSFCPVGLQAVLDIAIG